jgi:hypothetical protein
VLYEGDGLRFHYLRLLFVVVGFKCRPRHIVLTIYKTSGGGGTDAMGHCIGRRATTVITDGVCGAPQSACKRRLVGCGHFAWIWSRPQSWELRSKLCRAPRSLSAYGATGIVPLAHVSTVQYNTIQYSFKKKSACVYVELLSMCEMKILEVRGKMKYITPLPVPLQPATFSFISLP